MNSKLKLILKIIAIVLISSSVFLNVYFISKTINSKKQTKEILDKNFDPVIKGLLDRNKELNDKTKDNIEDFQDVFENSDVIIAPTKEDKENGKEYVTITIVDKVYETILSDDIEESKKQVKFLTDRINELTEYYTEEIEARDKLVEGYIKEIEDLKKNVEEDVVEIIDNTSNTTFVNDIYKFGLDLYFVASSIPPSLDSFSAGVGLNFMFIKSFNIRVNVGMDYRNSMYNPEFGVAIGYYFK